MWESRGRACGDRQIHGSTIDVLLVSRTIRDFRLRGWSWEQARALCQDWLARNEFSVIDLAADKSGKRYPIWGVHLWLHPTPGSLVAVSGKLSGAVVFELAFFHDAADANRPRPRICRGYRSRLAREGNGVHNVRPGGRGPYQRKRGFELLSQAQVRN